MTVRILVINGNTMEEMTAGIRREANGAASPGVEVVTVTPEVGPLTIETYYDDYLAIPGILKAILENEDDYDAFVIACWGDPGIEAAREITDKPVVGIAEASMYVCNMIAAKWAVATVLHRIKDFVGKAVLKTGFHIGPTERCIGVFTTDLTVADTEHLREAACNTLEDAGRKAIAEGAEAIALGCAGMSGLDVELEEKLGIPVVDSVRASVQMAESLVRLGKRTSKANTYKFPELKPFKGYDEVFQTEQWEKLQAEPAPEGVPA
ncbi:MAG TPA: aspartate/glutamate racemase family protein [Candidatus Sulfomarinibacteraceae bacterium]|nr:aspartate/glutamate racemase family protein [Candidatus Sulfomarinibacteraceae bacterium]